MKQSPSLARRRALLSRRASRRGLVMPLFFAAIAILAVAVPAHASEELELTPDLFITAILLVAFVAIVFPLNALIFRPLFQVIDERENKIDGSRRRAASVEVQAQAALARYQDAVREAREESMLERRAQLETARADLLATTRRAKEEAERELEHAREGLEASLSEGRETLRAGSEELARLGAERILGRSLS